MEEKKIEVVFSSTDLIKSKFVNSLSTLEGYLLEARGDISVSQKYTANAVFKRMEHIKAELMRDIERLSNDIKIS